MPSQSKGKTGNVCSLGIIWRRMFPREHTAPYAPLYVCMYVCIWYQLLDKTSRNSTTNIYIVILKKILAPSTIQSSAFHYPLGTQPFKPVRYSQSMIDPTFFIQSDVVFFDVLPGIFSLLPLPELVFQIGPLLDHVPQVSHTVTLNQLRVNAISEFSVGITNHKMIR